MVILGALAALVAIGLELGQMFILVNHPDHEAMVRLALAINTWPTFSLFLMAALVGVFTGLLILGICLWRARFLPIGLFGFLLAAIGVGFIPFPGQFKEIVTTLFIQIPFLWIGWSLLRLPAVEWSSPLENPARIPGADPL
jgi:hypothetical protein